MKIPCKDCLLLAACRVRTHITCGMIHEWIQKNSDFVGAELREYLPKWQGIYPEPNDGLPIIVYKKYVLK
jgi:hypothetical protein